MILNAKHLNLDLTPDIILIRNRSKTINYLLQRFVEPSQHHLSITENIKKKY